MGSGKDQILKCGVEGDELVIRIGIDTLVFAAGLMPGDEPLPTVVNHEQFAHDVVAELNSEEEDGTTPLHVLFDKAMVDTFENGSMAFEEEED